MQLWRLMFGLAIAVFLIAATWHACQPFCCAPVEDAPAASLGMAMRAAPLSPAGMPAAPALPDHPSSILCGPAHVIPPLALGAAIALPVVLLVRVRLHLCALQTYFAPATPPPQFTS